MMPPCRLAGLALVLALACGTSGRDPTADPTPPRSAAPAAGDSNASTAAPAARDEGPRWLKGQLHLHSDASGDSDTPPAEVVDWYAEHDYDFIVFTDHNRLTQIASTAEMLVLPGVELTSNLPQCSPPPVGDDQCLLHVNALIVDPARVSAAGSVPQPTTDARVDHFAHAMAVAEAMGGLAQLNHPNFHYAANAAQLTDLTSRGLVLFEVANAAWDSNNAGDADHPSTEQMWDRVLTAGGRLYGTATDDAHHYEDAGVRRAAGAPVFVGDLGWVMVRASREPTAIGAALRRGDFYASTGVELDDIVFADGVLQVRAPADAKVEVRFVVDEGAVALTVPGPVARYDTRGKGHTYVRAVVTDRAGHRAWVQPVFLDGPG